MTPLQSELLKIVVDKGLLAGIFVVVGFWFNRVLEKFRAKNTYLQKLAEARIGALADLHRAVLVHMVHVQKFQGFVARDPRTIEPKLLTDLVAKTYSEMVRTANEMQSSVFKHMVFIPKELHEGILLYVDKSVELLDLAARRDSTEFRNNFEGLAVQLVKEGASLGGLITVGVQNNPFEG